MRLWTFIIVLCLATLIGITIRQDPGYALFAYRNWTLEMPLWVAAALFIVLLTTALCLTSLLRMFLSSGARIKQWWFTHKQTLARRNTTQGLLELTEGHWLKAERHLRDAAPFSDAPIVNYLAAAKAAEEGGAHDRRDQYLQLAYDNSGHSDVAVRLTEAELRFKQGDVAQSIASLQNLQKEHPKHPQVLRLLAALYETTQNWEALYHLLPALRKANVFSSQINQELLEQKIFQTLLPLKAKDGKAALTQCWRTAPNTVQKSNNSLALYVQGLIAVGAETEAEALLKARLKKTWDPKLGYLYGKVKGASTQKQLNFAESLLPGHEQDPMLLLTLGHLCFKSQLWGKAKDYLEASIALQASAEGYLLLAELMDKLGFPVKRDEYYKKGLFCATSRREEA